MKLLTKTVLKRPASVIVIVAALIYFGITSVLGMSMQLIPDMNLPIQLIMCTYPGAGPEDVEKLVTKPIEDGCVTISGVESVASYSRENLALIMLSFDYGTNMDKSFIDIMQAMETVKYSLPEDAGEPTVIAMDINASPVMYFSVNPKTESGDALSFVNEVLSPELEKIADVAQISVSGGLSDYISIELVPELLTQYNLNLTSVAAAVRDANFTFPAGVADYGGQTINASAKGEYKTPEELKTIPITTPTGGIIHLSDVANVHYAYKDPTSYSRYNGGDDISVSVTKTQQSSAVTLSRQLLKLVDRLNEDYPDFEIIVTFNTADTITDTLVTLGQTLLIGIAITMLVLLLFFGNLKGSLIVASSMPVCVLATIVLMGFFGFTLNVMTLGALVIAIGMMVDNAIVVIEMCYRKQEEGLDFFDAALEGTGIVMSSIIASTITTVVVYLPMALIKGLSGQLFSQLGYTIVFALITSLISAITLVPLCFYMYKPTEKENNKANLILEKIGNKYGKLLDKALIKKKTTAAIAVIIFAISIALCQLVNAELMPASDEGRIEISLGFRPGTKVDIINEKVLEIEEFVANSPYVESYSSSAGGGSGTISGSSGSGGSVSAKLKDGIKTKEVVSEWTPILMENARNYTISVESASSTMGFSGLSGGASYEVDIESASFDTVRDAVRDVSDNISQVPGVLSVSSSLSRTESRADIIIDPLRASAAGLTPRQVAGSIYSMVYGSNVFDVNINDKEYTVSVEYPQGYFGTINDIFGITLMNTRGMDVPLSEVADIVYTDSPTTIYKSDGKYVAQINAAIDIKDRYSTQKAIDDLMKKMSLPEGVSPVTNNLNEMMNEEFMALAGAIVTAIILVYMVMAIQFNNLIYSMVVMACIPFSLIGSIALLLVTRITLNMTSIMGFLMLIGIVVNNGIIFVDYAGMLIEQGKDAVTSLVETGKSRLRPILMTTLTTILSMIPMGMGFGRNGQLSQGMAVVIIGGLTASTILTLVLLPTLYLIVYNFKNRKKKSKEY